MFATRFPSEHNAIKNAIGTKIVSFMSSSDGSFVFVKFQVGQPSLLFMIPYDYPTGKMQVSFNNEVPDHPFYKYCKQDTNLATVPYFKHCNTMMDYINTIYMSLDDTPSIINGMQHLSIDNTNDITKKMSKLKI